MISIEKLVGYSCYGALRYRRFQENFVACLYMKGIILKDGTGTVVFGISSNKDESHVEFPNLQEAIQYLESL